MMKQEKGRWMSQSMSRRDEWYEKGSRRSQELIQWPEQLGELQSACCLFIKVYRFYFIHYPTHSDASTETRRSHPSL